MDEDDTEDDLCKKNSLVNLHNLGGGRSHLVTSHSSLTFFQNELWMRTTLIMTWVARPTCKMMNLLVVCNGIPGQLQ